MSLVRRTSRNHPQQRTIPEVDDRATHPSVFDPLLERYQFTVDAAAAAHNARLPRFWDLAADGLAQSWAGETVWCNPPYSDIAPWVRKAWVEHHHARSIVMLLPANRTEQQWWQLYVEPFRGRAGSALSTEFLPGRLRFLRPGQTAVGPNERPPFGCMLLVWQSVKWATSTIPAGGLLGGAA